MRYLILSDTHGDISDAINVTKQWKGQINGVWHLGDHTHDLEDLEQKFRWSFRLAFAGVSGNCDYTSSMPHKKVFDVEGRRILMCHGHQYDVDMGLELITQAARDAGANIVLFGHTHIPYYKEENGILFLNPGSLTRPRGGSSKSYALLEIEKGNAAASLLNL